MNKIVKDTIQTWIRKVTRAAESGHEDCLERGERMRKFATYIFAHKHFGRNNSSNNRVDYLAA
jgi:hypothetical protein